MGRIQYIAYIMLVSVGIVYVSNESYKDMVAAKKEYDENVCLWRIDAANGIHKNIRKGHPNYKYVEVKCNAD